MDAALRAIAEPHRRRILDLVRADELSAGEISGHFDVTRPAVSQHLTVLKEAGLLRERRDGTRRLYRARPQGLAGMQLFLEGFWDQRLDSLRRHAEQAGPDVDAITERISVEREVAVDAPREVVWELLVDAERATGWMGVTARFDVRPGGSYRVEVLPGQVASGEFVVVDPPACLVHTWGWETDGSPVPAGSTIVRFELVAHDEGRTLLRLGHHDLPGVAAAGSHSRGWEHYLRRLGRVAAGDDPGPDPWVTDPDLLSTELRPPPRRTT